MELKVCRLCTLAKPIPEHDDVCRECWTVRMAGRALVTCPFYLFEVNDPNRPGGRAPIELCYDCAHREGWTELLGPICNHPVAINITSLWGVEVVQCPKQSASASESRWAPMSACRKCRFHRGVLADEAGRFAYCAIPYEMTARRAAAAEGRRETA